MIIKTPFVDLVSEPQIVIYFLLLQSLINRLVA